MGLALGALRGLMLALVIVAPAQAQTTSEPGQAAAKPQEFSEAERLLFMGKQMARIKPPATLRYTFRKSGALEEAFDDRVVLNFKRTAAGTCCAVVGDFLTGARRLDLPEVENAEANPVLLYFLERDIREMKRLTQWSPNYYRKRIRMAAFEAAKVSTVSVRYQGNSVAAKQIDLAPYDEDPARSRYEKFARKTYRFLMSDAVPGGVVGMRSLMQSGTDGAPPMILEELFLEGVALP